MYVPGDIIHYTFRDQLVLVHEVTDTLTGYSLHDGKQLTWLLKGLTLPTVDIDIQRSEAFQNVVFADLKIGDSAGLMMKISDTEVIFFSGKIQTWKHKFINVWETTIYAQRP